MPMTSNQIAAMAMQQQQMFMGNAAYSQMINPHGGMMGMAMGLPNASMGTFPSQHIAESMVGGGLAFATTMGRGLSTVGNLGAMGAGAAGLFGIGGPMLAAAGGIPGMMALGALEVAQFGGENVYAGFQERQNVNRVMRQQFGQRMGVGSGRGGMGFSSREMGDVSTMIREMAGEDIFAQVDDLTRVLEKTSQMRLYRGVQGAQQFKQRFRDLVGGLKEIAETLHTSLEGATEYLEQQRSMGFFRGQDISASLMRTRMISGASGIGMAEMQQIGMQGAQMGRMYGMRGRVGAGALQGMAGNVALAVGTGALSEEMLSEATGGLTGTAAAQAFAGQMMETNTRFFARGVGRPMLAGLWDPTTGGINRELMQRAASGQISIRELRTIARHNIAQSGGRRSEFFAEEERLRGQLLEEGGEGVMMGLLGQHFEQARGLSLEDPIMQRWLRRSQNMSQAQVEAMVQYTRELPAIMEERSVRFRQTMENEAMGRMRERTGLRGLRNRVSNMWERDVEGPLRQVGDDMVTVLTERVDRLTSEIEGTVNTHVSAAAQQAATELARTGRMGPGAALATDAELAAFRRSVPAGGGAPTTLAGRLGVALGIRAPGLQTRLERMGAYRYGELREGATPEQQQQYWEQMTGRVQAITPSNLGLDTGGLSRLQSDVARAVVLNKEAAGFGFGGRFGYESVGDAMALRPSMTTEARADFLNKRIEFLRRESTEFRHLTEGKSWEERAAILGIAEGSLTGGYKSPLSGVGGTSIEGLGERLARGQAQQENLILRMQQRSGGRWAQNATALGTGAGILAWGAGGGVAAWALGRARERQSSPDYAGLMTAATATPGGELQRYIRAAAADPNDPIAGLSREEARTQLGLLAEARGGANAPSVFQGTDLSTVERRALQLGLDNDETMRDMASHLERSRVMARDIIDTNAKIKAKELQNWLGQNLNDVKGRVEGAALDEFMAHVGRQSEGKQDREGLLNWLIKYGHTEEGANLAGVLSKEEGGPGVYHAAAINRMNRVYRELGDQQGDRGRRVLASIFQGAGVELEGSVSAQRRFQLEMARRLEREGEGGVTGVMAELQKRNALGTLAPGVGATDLERMLRQDAGMIKGGVTEAERLQRSAEQGAGYGLGRQGGNIPEEQRSMPEVARDQLRELQRLVKLTTAVAENSGNQKLIDAIRSINTSGDGGGGPTTPPAGNATAGVGGATS